LVFLGFRIKHFLFLIIIIIIITISGTILAVEIMPLDDIKPGMTGTGKTVFKGYQIESFPIEIIDVLRQDLGNHLILLKAGGEKINQIGGIAAGMSGTPLFMAGSLVTIVIAWQPR